MKCHRCGSTDIQHYRQLRSDRVWVVTARCENDHAPEKGKPFYSIALFDIASLPVLGEKQTDEPFALFSEPEKAPDIFDWLENRRKIYNQFQPIQRNP